MDDQIDDKTLSGILDILIKPFRTNEEVIELNKLLQKIHDFKAYTENFSEVMKG